MPLCLNYSLIRENLEILKDFRTLPDFPRWIDDRVIEVSFGGIWWNDSVSLKRAVIDDLNYKLRCVDSLFFLIS